MMETLIAKGHAYAAQGHVLFDVPSFQNYGRLSRRPLDEMIAGARVEVAPYKKSPADFVLWKPSTVDQPGWDSPWGRGRPGWHIECSAMIAESLGQTIDIHGGGQDLQFPHHENELAQSTCAHDGAPLAQIWMHNGFLNMGTAEKMSKSLGNIQTIPELQAQGWHGEVLRLALLSAHYRQPLEWTGELLKQTRSRLRRWARGYLFVDPVHKNAAREISSPKSLKDDLNTPALLAELSSLATYLIQTAGEVGPEIDRIATEFHCGLSLLGFGDLREFLDPGVVDGFYAERGEGSDDIDNLVEQRTAARAAKNWAESDRIRDELAAAGIILEDGPSGTTWRRA
jgi:cysteinyl-tRNA synthetase